ncbi:MAG: transaldolase, partial [Bacteroidetes bacterium]
NIDIVPKLTVKAGKSMDMEAEHYKEKEFRWTLNDDPMAHDKLSEGIRRFSNDLRQLEKYFLERI